MAKNDRMERFFDVLFARWWAGLLSGALFIAAGVIVWVAAPRADQAAVPTAADPEVARLLHEHARRRENRQKGGAVVMFVAGGALICLGINNLSRSVVKKAGNEEESST